MSITAPFALHALAEQMSGRDVAIEAARRARGFGGLTSDLVMLVRNGRGGERRRELRVATLEIPSGGSKTLVTFQAPGDLRGTALLTVVGGAGSSDQWLYLPALRRVKRIAAGNRSESFMGTEFSYQDLATSGVDQYRWTLTGVDSLHGMSAWVVQRTRLEPSSPYGRQLVWFDQVEYRVLRIDSYDRAGALLKTLTLSRFQQHGRFWKPHEMEMVNHQTGASTVLRWSNYVLGAGLEPRDFEPSRLDRGS